MMIKHKLEKITVINKIVPAFMDTLYIFQKYYLLCRQVALAAGRDRHGQQWQNLKRFSKHPCMGFLTFSNCTFGYIYNTLKLFYLIILFFYNNNIRKVIILMLDVVTY